MANIFKQMENRMAPFMIVAYPVAVLLLVISIILMIEDYNTSLEGYMRLPTSKIDLDYVPFAVAAIPQAGQVLLMFVFGRNTNKSWALWIGALLFLADLATDVIFKSSGNWGLVPVAVVESLFIFTLGSEVMFTIAGGFVLESMNEFMLILGQFIGMILNAFANLDCVANPTASLISDIFIEFFRINSAAFFIRISFNNSLYPLPYTPWK